MVGFKNAGPTVIGSILFWWDLLLKGNPVSPGTMGATGQGLDNSAVSRKRGALKAMVVEMMVAGTLKLFQL